MSDGQRALLAIFSDIEPAADAVEQLRHLGVSDDCVNIISGIPVNEAFLGRPRQWTNVPRLALGGAIVGFGAGLFLAFVSPNLYPIVVGGRDYYTFPPAVIVIFELTMLLMLLSTFLGVFLDSFFPNYRPMHYVPEISDGKIAILVECFQFQEQRIIDALKGLGAESVQITEAQPL